MWDAGRRLLSSGGASCSVSGILPRVCQDIWRDVPVAGFCLRDGGGVGVCAAVPGLFQVDGTVSSPKRPAIQPSMRAKRRSRSFRRRSTASKRVSVRVDAPAQCQAGYANGENRPE